MRPRFSIVVLTAWLIGAGSAFCAGETGKERAAGEGEAHHLTLAHIADPHFASASENPEPRACCDLRVKDLRRSFLWREAAVGAINEDVQPDWVGITGDLLDNRASRAGHGRLSPLPIQLSRFSVPSPFRGGPGRGRVSRQPSAHNPLQTSPCEGEALSGKRDGWIGNGLIVR